MSLTLTRSDTPPSGICLVCGDAVTERDLRLNPRLEYCLCELSPKQVQALEEDLTLVRRIQTGLLPVPVTARGWETGYTYEPAGVVGGDYCDLFVSASDPDAVYFAIADVAGKGVAASLLAAHLQAAVRSLAETRVPLSIMIETINEILMRADLRSHFATLICGRAEAEGRLEIVNAGHCEPLVVRNGEVEALGATGIPVGMLGGQTYSRAHLSLERGDAMFLYTDGLTEARSPGGDEYGVERLCRVLAQTGPAGPPEILRAAREDLARFQGDAAATDDLTVMVLHRVS
jgi:serine phosphatase RsbU (regulator of sigma subunit)